jgi:hypothetical protein
MAFLKSILPFWRHKASAPDSEAILVTPDHFGTASGFELQFDRLMDNPAAPRDTLFPTRSCRA